MDALLLSLGMYAVNCAGRLAVKSGIALTASYTTKQCSRLLKTVDDKGDRAELKKLRKLLSNKIKILSPAIDLIEFKSGRGNAFLEPAVPLVKSLHRDIANLGKRLEAAAADEEAISRQPGTRSARVVEEQHAEMKAIIADIKSLLARVDSDIHFLQLAISGSGETMSSSMPPGISPSRLMQASHFLNMGDFQFASDPTLPVQIGPSFTLSLYMLFRGHSGSSSSQPPTTNGGFRGGASKLPATPKTPQSIGGETAEKKRGQEPYGLGEGERKPIWQEVMHKARIRLCRTPPGWVFDRKKGYRPDPSTVSGAPTLPHTARTAFAPPVEYSYHLEIIEDLDDGRLHDDEEGTKHQPFDNIPAAGIRESMPIHQVSKIFYTDTGKLLNIGSGTDNNAVLLLKRDAKALSPLEVRRSWGDEPVAGRPNGHVEETAGLEAGDSDDDDQSDIDRQLFEESEVLDGHGAEGPGTQDKRKREFPPNLDREWLALEIYDEDSDDDDDDSDDERGFNDVEGFLYEAPDAESTPKKKQLAIMKSGVHGRPSSVDNRLLEQIRNISLRSSLSPTSSSPSSPRVAKQQYHHKQQDHHDGGADVEEVTAVTGALVDTSAELSFVARSPFGKVTSTLSLMEMLIRLTSLQEFQQSSHLAIPDHILTFFLEETSTTGLRGEQRWKVRSDTRRRVGFDPYTDQTPLKGDGQPEAPR